MVKLGDGPKVIFRGEWNICLKAFNGSNWSLVRLENVLHVTDLSVNSVPVISSLDTNLKMDSDRQREKQWQNGNCKTWGQIVQDVLWQKFKEKPDLDYFDNSHQGLHSWNEGRKLSRERNT